MDVNISEVCKEAEIIFNLTDPDSAYEFLYSSLDVLIITVLVPVVSVIGILGNAAFLFMAIRVKEVRQATVTIYLGNLAICDMLFLTFVNAWYIATYLSSPVNSSYPVSTSFGCAIWMVSSHWWYLGSLFFITLITVERYFAICKPLVHHIHFKEKSLTVKIIIAAWIVSFVLTLTGVVQFSRSIKHCVLWPKTVEFKDFALTFNDCDPVNVAADVYVHMLMIITLIISLILNFVLFVLIIKSLRRFSNRSSTEYVNRVTKQITRTLIANGIIFFVCQVPARIFSVDDVFDNLTENIDILNTRQRESTILLVGRAFLFLNSIINPFLYILTCKHYRASMLKAFCGDRCTTSSKDHNPQVGGSKQVQGTSTTSHKSTQLTNLPPLPAS